MALMFRREILVLMAVITCKADPAADNSICSLLGGIFDAAAMVPGLGQPLAGFAGVATSAACA
jgi:hypothetical protein